MDNMMLEELNLLEMAHGLNEPFLVVMLTVKNEEAEIVITDGNYEVLARKSIERTNCPEGEYTFYIRDGVMMLPSEY